MTSIAAFRHWRRIALVVATVLIVGFLASRVSWRLGVIALKSTGHLPELAWSDLFHMMRPGSEVWLQPLLETPNPYAVIRNPRRSAQAIKTGRILFKYECERCHGSEGSGGAGPPLVGRDLVHGSSDWALFKTIRDGVPSTAMPPHAEMTDGDLWNLVAYIQQRATEYTDAGVLTDEAKAFAPLDVRPETLRATGAAGDEWLTYHGSYNGNRFSQVADINRDNVYQLQARWIKPLPPSAGRIEATPLVASGRMFLTDQEGGVFALDARSGDVLWRYTRPLPRALQLCCVSANRGVALLAGKLYVTTLDAHLIALDSRSGKLLWDIVIADYKEGYTSTGAPLAIKNMIVSGIAGSEFGAPGFVTAFDADTGKVLWRFDTVPRPGEKGNDTWAGDSWRTGGVGTWMTGTYDPDLDLVYWGTANPAPDFDATVRAGDNLYSNSVLALHADTGRLAWYFQYTPGDDHDWDAVQTPVLADVKDNGRVRKLLLNANRNGFFYVLDRETGAFLHATPFVKQNWAARIMPDGRPVKRPEASGSERGSLVYPGASGGTNWWPPTYNPQAQLMIVPALERPGVFFKMTQNERRDGQQLLGGLAGSAALSHFTAVRALDPLTGNLRWEHRFSQRSATGYVGGLLSTAGGLVFTSDLSKFIALDLGSGAELWSFQAGAEIHGSPATYRIDGEQFIAIVAGQVVIGLALPPAVQEPPAS
jgi:alcohol dehydrogenase (cytochrome c)